MNAILTINLESEVLESAEQEARSRQTTLSEVLGKQLHVMASNWRDSQQGKTPITDSLRGTVKLPADFEAETQITEELRKKHG
jgi:hypothetical protein